MYGETGAAIRDQLAALLRRGRREAVPGPADHHRATGILIRQYRQTILGWSCQTLRAIGPLTFPNQTAPQTNPFRNAQLDVDPSSASLSPAGELARALNLARDRSDVNAASTDLLAARSDDPMLERWRAAARAAAIAERDTSMDVAAHMTVPQAQAIVGDIAAITQALIVLDQRDRHVPGWESLHRWHRLSWIALAASLDISLGQPDFSVDHLGWRPRTHVIKGAPRPGILGVLQAEHNLLVRMQAFPSAPNLRYVVDSQRILSARLAQLAERVDERAATRIAMRASAYTVLRQQLRQVGSHLGHGGLAAAESANIASRLSRIPADTIVDPRVLAGFETIFVRLDPRICNVIEHAADRRVYAHRVKVPRIGSQHPVGPGPYVDQFVPLDRASYPELFETTRALRRASSIGHTATPGTSRVALATALSHSPGPLPRPMTL